jgi:predicted HicB family RNase H-like nuclease
MTRRKIGYVLGDDIPEAEILRESAGRAVHDSYVEAAVEEAIATVRRRGRPSLSRSGVSPVLRVRITVELDDALTRAAEHAGTTRAEWIRHALDEATRKAS